jgi:hypothetical protein
VRVLDAHPIANFLRIARWLNAGVSLPVDNKHGARLRGEIDLGSFRKKALGCHYASVLIPDAKNPVWLQIEVTCSALLVGRVQDFSIFDIQPDGRQILFVHPGVHREHKRAVSDSTRQAVKASIRLLLRVPPKEPNAIGAKIDGANHIRGAPK